MRSSQSSGAHSEPLPSLTPWGDLWAKAHAETTSTDRSKYRDDPVGYFRNVLGVEPWARQCDLLEAVAQHRRVSCRTGHKVSKSNSAGGLALWWYDTRPRGRVVLTAPSNHQVEDIVWRELRAMHTAAGRRGTPIPGHPADKPWTGLRMPDGREVIGFSTDKPERFAGISGDELLFIVDEASGFPEEIFAALFGNTAGGASVLLLGNPTQVSGTFHDSFGTKADYWHNVHISSEESPNVIAGHVVVPGLATREYVEESLAEHGEESPFYQIRVRGNFPTTSTDTVIGVGLVQAAKARFAPWTSADTSDLALGVDPARFGDDESTIAPVRGKRCAELVPMRSLDTVEVAGRVLETARELGRDGETIRIQVDEIGIGAGVLDHLTRHTSVKLTNGRGNAKLVVVGVNASENAPTSDRYHRLRDQVWFATRDWLKEGGAIPNDGRLVADLTSPRYSFDTQGRHVVEPKKITKKRLGRSPDRADALGLAVFKAPIVEDGCEAAYIPGL